MLLHVMQSNLRTKIPEHFLFPCLLQGVSQCATEALVPGTSWKLAVFLFSCLLQGVSQCATGAPLDHPFFRRLTIPCR